MLEVSVTGGSIISHCPIHNENRARLLMADELEGSDLEKLINLADVFPTISNQIATFALLSFKFRKKYLSCSFDSILL